MLTKQKGYETMQKAWTFPSKHEQEYIEQVDENIKKMLMSLGMKCGVANISFFYRDGKFYVFETGFRLGGGHSFDYQRASGGIDYLTAMIRYALGEEFEPDMELKEDRGFAVTYNVYFKAEEGDIVEEVMGEEVVKGMSEIVTYLPCLYKGCTVKNSKAAKIAMLTFHADDLDTVLSRIETVNDVLAVKTDKGICRVFAELTASEVMSAIL
jgi:biotin carboxylase